MERVEIIRDLRLGEFDVLVGINLLREGLDMPEVSLVAVFDADKEGFLRSEQSLIQTIGRAARHAKGKAILYADKVTGSIQRTIDETERRRSLQLEYNLRHGIIPKTIEKSVGDILEGAYATKQKNRRNKSHVEKNSESALGGGAIQIKDFAAEVTRLEDKMYFHARNLEFEQAAQVRDQLTILRKNHLMS